MSTYYDIIGEVTLDAPALEALKGRPSWVWMEPDEEPNPHSGSINMESHDDGSVTFSFADLYRNLGRYLENDLVICQRNGDVAGLIVSYCTDGVNGMQVTSFSGREVRAGESECLNAEVTLMPVSVRPVPGLDSEISEDGLPEYHLMLIEKPGEQDGEKHATHAPSELRACWCGACPNPDAPEQAEPIDDIDRWL